MSGHCTGVCVGDSHNRPSCQRACPMGCMCPIRQRACVLAAAVHSPPASNSVRTHMSRVTYNDLGCTPHPGRLAAHCFLHAHQQTNHSHHICAICHAPLPVLCSRMPEWTCYFLLRLAGAAAAASPQQALHVAEQGQAVAAQHGLLREQVSGLARQVLPGLGNLFLAGGGVAGQALCCSMKGL